MEKVCVNFHKLNAMLSAPVSAFPSNSNDLECIKNGNYQAALYKVPP